MEAGQSPFVWLPGLRATAHDPGRTVRLPFILSHRGPETDSAPPELIAKIVNTHLALLGNPLRAWLPQPPTRHALVIAPGTSCPSRAESVIIPSTLTAPHFLPCLERLLTTTVTPQIEVVVAVGQAAALDEAQRHIAMIAQSDKRVRVVHLAMTNFNFSAVNNLAASLTAHQQLLLLNDDAAPISANWLNQMVAHLEDPRVGIVGV
jgi:hypothetical protein